MCLAIAAIVNAFGGCFWRVSCEAEWHAGNVSQTAKLGVKTYGGIDAIQAGAALIQLSGQLTSLPCLCWRSPQPVSGLPAHPEAESQSETGWLVQPGQQY